MGVIRRSRALKTALQARAEARVEAVEQQLDTAGYRGVKRAASAAVSGTRKGASHGQRMALDLAERSDRVSRVGKMVRVGVAELASLPLVTITTDSIRAWNGVPDAARRASKAPEDALIVVQYAEALRRADEDLKAYRSARALVDPGSVALRTGLRAGASLGRTDVRQPLATRLARKAALLGLRRVREDRLDAEALDALARAAIIEGRVAEAVRLAEAAVQSGSRGGLALVTLARAHLAAGELATAAKVAEQAVTEGSTVAYEVLAECAVRDTTATAREQAAVYDDLLDRVTADDTHAYYGVPRTAGSFARTLTVAQAVKTWNTTRRLATGAGRATAAGVKRAARKPANK